jgi:hypothetical protein
VLDGWDRQHGGADIGSNAATRLHSNTIFRILRKFSAEESRKS